MIVWGSVVAGCVFACVDLISVLALLRGKGRPSFVVSTAFYTMFQYAPGDGPESESAHDEDAVRNDELMESWYMPGEPVTTTGEADCFCHDTPTPDAYKYAPSLARSTKYVSGADAIA